MDSDSSGSVQSSSGGDEEFKSRAGTNLAFSSNPQDHLPSVFKYSIPHPLPQQDQTQMFDRLSSYSDQIRRPSSLSDQNLVHNNEMLWSKPLISVPNRDVGAVIPSSSSSLNPVFIPSQIRSGQTGGSGLASFPATHHSPLTPDSTGASSSGGFPSALTSTDGALHDGNNHNILSPSSSTTANNNVMRNPKKRSRASSRAPTTVLTTDTTNFRAMVQEFTGVPAPLFTSTSFPKSLLNFYGTAAASNLRSAHFDPSTVPPYLLLPFAHKLQPVAHPFMSPPSSSSSSPSFPSCSAMVVDSLKPNSTSSTVYSTSFNYQLSYDLELLKQTPENLLNMNMHTNSIFDSQSLFPTPSKYPLANSSSINLGPKSQGYQEITSVSAIADPNLKMRGVFEEYGLSHDLVNTNAIGVQNMANSSSNPALSGGDAINKNNASSHWSNVGGTTSVEANQTILRSNVSGTYRTLEGVITYDKGNCSISSSDFHGDKDPDCVAPARTEGMVESWIDCSSE